MQRSSVRHVLCAALMRSLDISGYQQSSCSTSFPRLGSPRTVRANSARTSGVAAEGRFSDMGGWLGMAPSSTRECRVLEPCSQLRDYHDKNNIYDATGLQQTPCTCGHKQNTQPTHTQHTLLLKTQQHTAKFRRQRHMTCVGISQCTFWLLATHGSVQDLNACRACILTLGCSNDAPSTNRSSISDPLRLALALALEQRAAGRSGLYNTAAHLLQQAQHPPHTVEGRNVEIGGARGPTPAMQ